MNEFCGSQFWDLDLTWHTENPDFTPCFQRTILLWIPCGFLWILAPYEIYSAIQSGTKNIPWTSLILTKCGITILIIILQLTEVTHILYEQYKVFMLYPVDQYAPVVKTLTFILILFLDLFNRYHGVRSCGLIFLFWLFLGACELSAFRSAIMNTDSHFPSLYSYVVEVIYFPLIVSQICLNCWADADPLEDINLHKANNPCPEKKSSFVSQILFFWFDKLARKGYKRPLEFSDLWDLVPEDTSSFLNIKFNRYWKQELNKAEMDNTKERSKRMPNTNSTPSKEKQGNIFKVICKSFTGPLLSGGLYRFVADILSFIPPIILNFLIGHVQSNDPNWKGYFYALCLFLSSFGTTIIHNQFFYHMMRAGMRMRTTAINAIYRKSLRISNAAKDSTIGEIITLMSVDAQRLNDLSLYLHVLWSSPLRIGLSLFGLWALLGPAMLAGLAIMILLIPINAVIATKLRTLQMKQMDFKDQRIKLMSEILNGIKILKLHHWEHSFATRILKIRKNELKVIRRSAFYNAGIILIWSCSPFLVSLATFATYVLMDNVLDAKKAFVSLTLFNLMRLPLNLLSMVLVYIIQTGVSMKRINKFMNSAEIDDNFVTHDDSESDAIVIENASFSWKSADPILRNINLRIKQGSLVAIVGSVGVGKSTFLSGILGETDRCSGHVNTKGRLAYVAQQAWIQNATVRDNILFGLPFEPSKYEKVIDSCALKPDLGILPASDKTEIGEKGINLSGGQKQRVALARAAYNNADVYLLDDPLSSVDAHVGKHLFENVIGPRGMLRWKTRVLVTHSVTFLPEVDYIVVLKDGEISDAGTYRELLDTDGAFADFLKLHVTSDSEDSMPEPKLEKVLDAKESLKAKLDLPRRTTENLIESGRLINTPATSRFTLSHDAEPIHERNNLIEEESVETGTVKLSIFIYYMRTIGWPIVSVILFFNVASEAFSLTSNLWLSDWSNQGSFNSSVDDGTRNLYLGVYGALGGGLGISVLISTILMAIVTLKVSGYMHWVMLNRVLKAPISFFDTTPTGRIVNRFARDIDVADNDIPMNFAVWLNCLFTVIATFGIICFSTPIFALVVLPISVLYFYVQRYYVASTRQLRRLESVSRSPIYSHFGETLTGIATIRAFKKQEQFIRESETKVDLNQASYFPSFVADQYISIFLELIGNIVVFFAAVFAIMFRDNVGPSPGLVGLSITYAMQMTDVLNWFVKMTSDAERNMVSVERLKEYGEVVQEASWQSKGQSPGKYWPEEGEIIFDNYQARYRTGLDLVLKGVTCRISPGEKIGIVGRTGAGKSTLTLGLFRIIEPAAGSIKIDGKDISQLGLQDLRRRLTIIPQDPIIFSGTLRMNLDPFTEYRDEFLWHALDQAHLKHFVKGLGVGLDFQLTEGGDNLSVGQRQLLCLARALLRKTKILILDEATAAIDLDTDDIIQETIRTEFRDSTVLTIAHRLNTIMDYNRVMVLENGVIREFDAPEILLEDKKSLFYGMARNAGLI